MDRWKLNRCVCVWLCWLLPLAAQAQSAFTGVVVVGDSLSDSGNGAAARDFISGDTTPFPPYSNGLCNPVDVLPLGPGCDTLFFQMSRVTDGPVAVEHLAEALGLAADSEPSFYLLPPEIPVPISGLNYAVASAKARAPGVEDLASQVGALLLDHGGTLPPQALYVVIIGGNDVVDAVQALASSSESPRDIIRSAVDSIVANVELLIDSGARYVLVANVPNVGALPAVRELLEGDSPLERLAGRIATFAARTFNVHLWWRLRGAQFRHPSAQIQVFDLFGVLERELALARFWGRNFTDACFRSDIYFDSPIGERVFHPDCAPEVGGTPRFDRFVFWDVLHPTGRVHVAIGEALLQAASEFSIEQ